MPALNASAISVSLVEDSATRFAFDVVWDEVYGGLSSVDDISDVDFFVTVTDFGSVIFVSSPLLPIPLSPDAFTVGFASSGLSSRVFESGDLSSFDGVQSLGIPGNSYGARFVYGSPFPADPPTGVPDNGASALLLSAGLAGLTLLRRTFV